jgi:hypothetical protein
MWFQLLSFEWFLRQCTDSVHHVLRSHIMRSPVDCFIFFLRGSWLFHVKVFCRIVVSNLLEYFCLPWPCVTVAHDRLSDSAVSLLLKTHATYSNAVLQYVTLLNLYASLLRRHQWFSIMMEDKFNKFCCQSHPFRRHVAIILIWIQRIVTEDVGRDLIIKTNGAEWKIKCYVFTSR